MIWEHSLHRILTCQFHSTSPSGDRSVRCDCHEWAFTRVGSDRANVYVTKFNECVTVSVCVRTCVYVRERERERERERDIYKG